MSSFSGEDLAAAVAALESIWPEWLDRRGVNWLDVGPETSRGHQTGNVAVRAFVDHKRPLSELITDELFPDAVGKVPVDLLEASLDQALIRSEKELAELPPLGAMWALRGHMLSAVRHFDQAAVAYQRALELDPGDTAVAMALGQVLAESGRTEEAEAVLFQAMDRDPSDTAVAMALGQVLAESGRTDEANELMSRWTVESDQSGERNRDVEQSPSTAESAVQTTPPPARVDQVYTLPDAPDPIDRLGRKPLAESLAARLRMMRAEDRATSFLLHIDGPWGAGKSSLLKYLHDELKADSLVVDLNAWREQRVGPPWLGLLMALRRAAYQQHGWVVRVPESLARLRAVGAGYLAAVLVTAGITAVLLWWAAAGDFNVTSFGEAAKSIGAVSALAATVWAVTAGVSRHWLPGSPRQAEHYIRSHADPMQKVADHFDEFLGFVKDPVVFFVDDLDRCTESYVVEFLEAVQTLLREAPTTRARNWPGGRRRGRTIHHAPYFVVAADARWIRASYEKVYTSFADEVTHPGRPLGYLFLEKAFQLTTTLPAIDDERRQAYMDYLLRIDETADALVDGQGDIQRAEEVLDGARTDSEILERIEQHRHERRSFRFALRGQAVKHMARPEVAKRLEHALSDYADLLEPNPRAMKRFVNAYGIERALRTIENRHPRLDQLARWTIVLLRWPELADILRVDPAAVELIGSPVRGVVPDGVRQLFTDSEVIRVVKDTDPRHGEPLDAAAVKESAGLSLRGRPGAGAES